jgi:copper(I)-binding protein
MTGLAADARVGRDAQAGRDARGQLLRAGLAPVICALVLLGLLTGWVASGGAGTISRVRIKISSASLAMPVIPNGPAYAYLVVENLGAADTLESAAVPGARQVRIVRHNGSAASPGRVLTGLAIRANGTVSLSPMGPDIELIGAHLIYGQDVPLTLTFRNAGRVTVEAVVTPPGTP